MKLDWGGGAELGAGAALAHPAMKGLTPTCLEQCGEPGAKAAPPGR